jgi:hypothetical protein
MPAVIKGTDCMTFVMIFMTSFIVVLHDLQRCIPKFRIENLLSLFLLVNLRTRANRVKPCQKSQLAWLRTCNLWILSCSTWLLSCSPQVRTVVQCSRIIRSGALRTRRFYCMIRTGSLVSNYYCKNTQLFLLHTYTYTLIHYTVLAIVWLLRSLLSIKIEVVIYINTIISYLHNYI